MPPLLAVAGSEGILILQRDASIMARLRENIRAARKVLEKTPGIEIPSDDESPIIHIHLRPRSGAPLLTAPPSYFALGASEKPSADALHFGREERVLQQIVEESVKDGVLITRARRLKGQESPEPRPSIRLSVTAAMSVRETEDSVRVVRDALLGTSR